ncbi:MAG: response regulator [Treponema sp.]|jgi:CheY-like chemotaxis protein|nr:response regulator [Treponema sp.]
MAGDKKNILTLDDSVTQLAIYKSLLGSQYTLWPCTSPLKALQLLKKASIDLITVDIEMPEMTGFEFVKEIKKDKDLKEIPVIVISSHKDIQDAVKHGASAYIKKPVKAVELREKIAQSLGAG